MAFHFLWKVLTLLAAAASLPIGSCWLPFRSGPQPTRFAFSQQLQRRGAARKADATRTRLYDRNDDETSIYDDIVSPVLRQVYPKLMKHIDDYGNPNIPLGSSEGRQCETLRRLQLQNKLTEREVELLTGLGFRWHSLEDVYKVADFDELYQRLLQYREEHDGDVSPPKKYPLDSELGAWVTGLRRLGHDQVDPKHRAKLDEIGFSWISQRKCGSSFMKQYRVIAQQLNDGADLKDVWSDETNKKWLKAQQLAVRRKDLSETRQHYLEQLLGADWTEV